MVLSQFLWSLVLSLSQWCHQYTFVAVCLESEVWRWFERPGHIFSRSTVPWCRKIEILTILCSWNADVVNGQSESRRSARQYTIVKHPKYRCSYNRWLQIDEIRIDQFIFHIIRIQWSCWCTSFVNCAARIRSAHLKWFCFPHLPVCPYAGQASLRISRARSLAK